MPWLDNADSYICPVCGFEVNNPNKYGCKSPKCGFIADSDKDKVSFSDFCEDILEIPLSKQYKHFLDEIARKYEAKEPIYVPMPPRGSALNMKIWWINACLEEYAELFYMKDLGIIDWEPNKI